MNEYWILRVSTFRCKNAIESKEAYQIALLWRNFIREIKKCNDKFQNVRSQGEIDVYGFDYDYTLATYRTDVEELIHYCAKQALVDKFKVMNDWNSNGIRLRIKTKKICTGLSKVLVTSAYYF